MNQQDALQKFVSEHFKALTSLELTAGKYKELERSHFNDPRLRYKIKRPGPRQTIDTLFAMLRKRGLPEADLARYVSTLPIFSLSGDTYRSELINKINSREETGIEEEHLNLIREVGSFEAAKDVAQKAALQAKYQELEELQTAIEHKKLEYHSVPSILDLGEQPEPSFDPQIENTRPWWQRFYLKADPFPRKDGLSDIDEDMYDEVIVRTKPFEEALSALERNPRFLFNTAFLLAGDYGFGKTTFIDYLSYYLVNHDIHPVRITCGRAFPDSDGFLSAFYIRLRNELHREKETIGAHVVRSLEELDLEQQIVALAEALCANRHKGLVVFLDDYHKHRSHFSQVFDFLGLLQILKDLLSRSHVPVGFIVAGTREWLTELRANGQMAGFLDNTPIEMPDITPELVVEVFNQRLRAFCYDQSPRSLQVEFVRRIFKEIDGAKAGFRDFLTRIISELARNNLAIINTPIDISDALLADIRSIIDQDSALKSSLNKLIFESKFKSYTQDQVRKCLELLITVLNQDGVTERDRLFLENQFYFLLLRDVGLIQKAKRKEGASVLRWVGHHRLQRAVIAIQSKHGLSPSDYLLKLYGDQPGSAFTPYVDVALPSDLLEGLKYLTNPGLALSKSVETNIQMAWRAIDAVWKASAKANVTTDLLERAERGLEALSNAFFELDRSSGILASARLRLLDQKWQGHWLSDEAVLEFFKRVGDCHTDHDGVKVALALKQFKESVTVLVERLRLIVEDWTTERFGGLVARSIFHTSDEISIFDDIRVNYYAMQGQAHFDYVRRVTDYLEMRFRSFLFVSVGFLFGESNMLQHFDESTRNYAYKNVSSRSQFGAVVNPFDGFTRSQFRSAFVDGTSFKRNVIDRLECPWRERDWSKFFEVFTAENVAIAHQQIGSFDPVKRQSYYGYATMAETVMTLINEFARRIVTNYVYICGSSQTPQDVSDCVFRFSLRNPGAGERVAPGYVVGEDFSVFKIKDLASRELRLYDLERVVGAVEDQIDSSANDCVIEDLMDVGYIVNKYAVNYFDFVNALAYGVAVSKRVVVNPWFGSSICILRRG